MLKIGYTTVDISKELTLKKPILSPKNLFQKHGITTIDDLKKWLKKNNYYKPSFDKFTSFKELSERLPYENGFFKIRYQEAQELEQKKADDKYLELFQKIVDYYPYQKIEKHSKYNVPQYIYKSLFKILILANIKPGVQQLILYDKITGNIEYGQCMMKYKIRPNKIQFDGKYIFYGGHNRNKWEYIEVTSIAPYWTAYNNSFQSYDFQGNGCLRGGKANDSYIFDLGMFDFVNIRASYDTRDQVTVDSSDSDE